MTDLSITSGKVSLPLLPPAQPSDVSLRATSWEGFLPAEEFTAAEPLIPQGAYGVGETEPSVSLQLASADSTRPVELLAPAGGMDAGLAAFHFGADAIYLGLKKFSARAEAENFTLAEVDEITAYAHSLTPRRRVFVTVNTVIRQDELAELVDDLAALADIGVDAIILQDLGVYRVLRRFFPQLEVHGSTQMAVHNRAGAEALRRLGFARVVLARELTFEEVNDITSAAGIETEVFIHGALCYSYSGLCLFSAQTLGRSGNRGKCAYSCRDSFEVTGAPLTLRDGSAVKRDPRTGFPFSMKDLALPDHLPVLRSAGVSCFKIEGRKKSPLYVATTTDYYRRLLDGRLDESERPNIEADLQTVFSRPWTKLFVASHKDKEVADRDTVGHRGTPIGTVEAIVSDRAGSRLRFRTSRALQRHDGLQIDLPALGKPFGFAVERLGIVQGADRGRRGGREGANAKRSTGRLDLISVAAGSVVEVGLPADHPEIPVGAPVYCSSSQEVKQRYRHERPKPGLYRRRKPLLVEGTLTEERLTVTARIEDVTTTMDLNGPFAAARDVLSMEAAVRGAFERLGDSRFELASITWHNEEGLFVPLSRLNDVRRQVVADLEEKLARRRAEEVARIKAEVCPRGSEATAGALRPLNGKREFLWSIKVDRADYVRDFEDSDWADVEEVVIDIARDHPTLLRERLDDLARRIGRDRIRLALPPITRAWEERGLLHKIEMLREAGWSKWEAGNLSAWTYLGLNSDTRPRDLDLATDWSVYVLNRMAALELMDQGVSRFCLSPEDGLANCASLLAEFADRAVVIVHQDTPLFLAESCAYANLIGGCPGKANCSFESMEMVSSHGEKVTALDYHCRTIVLNQGPFCLSTRLKGLRQAGAVHLRADFIYRPYNPLEVRQRWRLVRAGKPVPGGHCANWERGLL